MSDKPYLSVVVVSRNDDHSGSAIYRMQLFIKTLFYQLDKYKVSSELIIVEWNPPANCPGLYQVLTFPQKRPNVKVRLITVPVKVHKRYPYHDVLRLYQFIAKNVGIRRAQGRYILSTNMDILFSDKIIKFLSQKKLKNNQMLRAIRCDVPAKININWNTDQILMYCRRNAFRIYNPSGCITEKTGNNIMKILRNFYFQSKKQKLFTNACGDFTLLSRDYWYKARGYPEFPYHGVKIDGLLCYIAYHSGAKELILNHNSYIYHLDHGGSWSSEDKDFEPDLKEKGIPFISRIEYAQYINTMRNNNKPIIINNNNWGLSFEKFKEREI